MTAMRCCIHTHSTLCDGKHTMAEMAEAAVSMGVRHYGFSGHSHTPIPLDREITMSADSTAYRAEAMGLREEYRGQMEILCGLEWDAFSDVSHEGWDYWIGSVHHIRAGGQIWAVDWKAEALTACRDEVFGGDIYAVTQAYFQQVAAVAEKKPTILGHLDLICKLNGDGGLFEEASPRYRSAALEALRAVDPAATLLEINTGAMARGYRTTPYPAPFLLAAWQRMGGGVIVTSDAHNRNQVLFGYELAQEAARRAGFCETWILTYEGAKAVEL